MEYFYSISFDYLNCKLINSNHMIAKMIDIRLIKQNHLHQEKTFYHMVDITISQAEPWIKHNVSKTATSRPKRCKLLHFLLHFFTDKKVPFCAFFPKYAITCQLVQIILYHFHLRWRICHLRINVKVKNIGCSSKVP